MLWLSHDVVPQALADESADTAQEWLQLREYRQATSVTIVDSLGARALKDLTRDNISTEEATIVIGNDLRDTYFFRLRDALTELNVAVEDGYRVRAAEWFGQAKGYFRILAGDFTEKLGNDITDDVLSAFDDVDAILASEDWSSLPTTMDNLRNLLANYQPVELSEDLIAERARLLYLFLDLVYIEYRDGVRNGEITIPIEYQETTTFLAQSVSIYEEIRPIMSAVDPEATDRLRDLLADINAIVVDLGDSGEVEILVTESKDIIQSTLDIDVETGDVTATFTVVDTLLDELLVTVSNGQYDEAERTRIEAYGLFESGPELRLANLAPVLSREIEGLFWEGSGGLEGLYTLLAQNADIDDVTVTLDEVRAKLNEAETFLGESLTGPIAALNSAIIIIREGLEAVLIIGAILAYMYKTETQRKFILWVYLGVAGAILLSIGTWFAAETFLTITPIQRELIEGVTSLIAVAVLFYVTNWLFHKTYVVDWMAYVREQASKALNNGRALGLAGLGFTVVYREGLETVLFYQALLFDADPPSVLIGFIAGLAIILVIAFAILRLSKRLPLKPLFTATTILLLIMAFSFTGSGVRELQEAGVVSTTLLAWFPENLILMELFGLFPTLETVLSQVIFTALIALTFTYSRWQGRREATPAT